jgi:hypothetical protein
LITIQKSLLNMALVMSPPGFLEGNIGERSQEMTTEIIQGLEENNLFSYLHSTVF